MIKTLAYYETNTIKDLNIFKIKVPEAYTIEIFTAVTNYVS